MRRRIRVTPGAIVRPKKSEHVHLWTHVQLNSETGRAMMRDRIGHFLTSPALVIAVPNFLGAGTGEGEGAVMLWVAKLNRFAWAWGSSLMVLQ